MYLTDSEIYEWAEEGGIIPFRPEHINPASIDLCLGSEWRDIEYPNTLNTPDKDGNICIFKASDRNSHIHLPSAILAITEEWINIPDNMVGQIKLKSTPTRMGLGHPIADWIDPGYEGKLTLMLNAVKDIRLPVGIRIVQLVLCKLGKSVSKSYLVTGHYQGQTVPMPARSDYVRI